MLTNSEKTQKFSEKIHEIYQEHANEILASLKSQRYITFRINKLRYTAENELLISKYPEIFKNKGPLPNTFFIENANKHLITESDLYLQGIIYVQGLSSMYSALELQPSAPDKILDLCAAPGSKTSLVAELSQNQAHITAVDTNQARLNAMKSNLQTLGVENVHCIKADASVLTENPAFINIFDKVVADVPCSNEGMLRGDSDAIFERWNPKIIDHLPKLQRRILFSGIQGLKPGGTLIYSTCTFSPEENEAVIDWALSKFPYITLQELNIAIPNKISGMTSYKKKNYNPLVTKCVRILPNLLYDGFFIAKLFRPVLN